jgi:hypothetical protein
MYRNDLIIWRMATLPKTVDETAIAAKVSQQTVKRARAAENLSVRTLGQICKSLKLDIKFLFDRNLKEFEFYRAVLGKKG